MTTTSAGFLRKNWHIVANLTAYTLTISLYIYSRIHRQAITENATLLNDNILLLLFFASNVWLIFILLHRIAAMRQTLGGTIDEIYDYMDHIGNGEFSRSATTDNSVKSSILGRLKLTHTLLKQNDRNKQVQINMDQFRAHIMELIASDQPLKFILTELASGQEKFNPASDSRTIEQIAGLASIAIEKNASKESLRIAATAFESQEGMFVTNADNTILRVNKAFTRITGYSAAEAVGKNPRLLKSGRHDASFYKRMWEQIGREGFWQNELWGKRKNGEVFPEWLTITAVRDDAGNTTHHVAAFTDITERKEAENQIQSLAFYDPLTSLPNRRLLMDRLKQALTTSGRRQRHGALILIDLDNFKIVNDTLGHDKGDMLLLQVAQLLLTCVRSCDTVGRLGGDEFVVIIEDLSEIPEEAATQARQVGEKILTTLNKTYQLANFSLHSSLSMGLTLFIDHKVSIDDLLKRIDLAMYQSKGAGRNTLRFFDQQMQEVVNTRVAMEANLRHAIENQQFVLYYQPQLKKLRKKYLANPAQTWGQTSAIIGAETLVRWIDPKRGVVPPMEFIPLAEETGLILSLGRWILESACTQLALWATQPAMAHLSIAVNVSSSELYKIDFVDQVLSILYRTGANPLLLKLELTESLLITNVEEVINKMSILKNHGVSFSLDDFGTGYSSLSYLKRLPLQQLKIDQSFVRDILIDPNDAAIAKMVIALAENLGLDVIAEGVETEAQHAFLASHGCHNYQGYLYSRPLPLAEFEAWFITTPQPHGVSGNQVITS